MARITVAQWPELRTVAVMLSSDRLTATKSKSILRAMASMHSRVRTAVFPARNIEVPNCISTSTASAAAEAVPVFVSHDEVTLSSERSLLFVGVVHRSRPSNLPTRGWLPADASLSRQRQTGFRHDLPCARAMTDYFPGASENADSITSPIGCQVRPSN